MENNFNELSEMFKKRNEELEKEELRKREEEYRKNLNFSQSVQPKLYGVGTPLESAMPTTLNKEYETIKAQSVSKPPVSVKRSKVDTKKIVANVALGTMVAGMISVFPVAKAIEQAKINNEISGIEQVLDSKYPDLRSEVSKELAKDSYYILNAKNNSSDEQATFEIYKAYRMSQNNIDEVFGTVYEISNNEEKYDFVPEQGYNIDFKYDNFDAYLIGQGYVDENGKPLYNLYDQMTQQKQRSEIENNLNNNYEPSIYEAENIEEEVEYVIRSIKEFIGRFRFSKAC